jgi:translation initiation factor IF-2
LPSRASFRGLGGTTLFAKISAKKKEGIKELLELIVLQSEMLELRRTRQAGPGNRH